MALRILVTGPRGAGKSTAVLEAARELARCGRIATGLVTLKRMSDPAVVGIDGLVLPGEERFPLADLDTAPERPGVRVGPYVFREEGLLRARRAAEAWPGGFVHVLDEVGPLELRGEGLAGALPLLGADEPTRMIVVAREELAEQVQALAPRADWRIVRVTVTQHNRPDCGLAALILAGR